jgi:predicted GIY-YIG superfamily endonuclease
MLNPLLIFPAVYVLRLEDDFYYVGITYNLNQRMSQHWTGVGARFTRLHKPIEVIKVVYPANERDIENKITREYIQLFGKEKVRGGKYLNI